MLCSEMFNAWENAMECLLNMEISRLLRPKTFLWQYSPILQVSVPMLYKPNLVRLGDNYIFHLKGNL